FFYCYGIHRDLHSFPTRRSSDLAFTGAVERREGKFEVAEGSTILLDEIGDMPLPAQAKLLNVLQSKKFMRVGGNKLINADVRIRSEEHTSELQSRENLVCRLLLE